MCGWLKHLLKSLSLDQFDPDFVQSSLSWTHPCPRDHFTTEKLCCDVKKCGREDWRDMAPCCNMMSHMIV